ncbi:MAG TPA: acyl-CoA dehydrogenase family protein [Pseudonocardia sp.]|jgi:alkylation response protein AidB-like acyl-CoA dehydrogenase|nr:acyl-CoA dehydrogenase family protein [Pseudonocardia sp.]
MTAVFEMTDEQATLRDAVRRLTASVDGRSDPGFEASRVFWSRLSSEIGLSGVLAPVEFGGAGGEVLDLAPALEELGAGLTPTPFFATAVLAVGLLCEIGDVEAMASHLPGLCAGTTTATVAVVGPDGDWSSPGASVHAVTDSGGYTLTGTASFVLDGTTADLLLVCASTPTGCGVFAVEADATGSRRTALETFDATRPLATLHFDRTPARLVGTEDESGAIAAMLDLAVVCLALEQVGGARHCLDMAVEYARERVQFGRAIGSFQAIKHWCADLLLDLESARSAAFAAAWALDRAHRADPAAPADPADPALARTLAALAGAVCSDTYVAIAAANIQIHGGMGFTWEHPAHRYLRRARSSAPLFGDPATHRERLITQLESHDLDLTLRPPAPSSSPSSAVAPARTGPVPDRLNIAAGLLRAHGSDELCGRLLEPLRTGEATWCLLYSEPEAGSDLASVQTTAVLTDDTYVVNGQKIWTSGAREADYGLLLARTDWDAPKHQGLSMFLLPMRQPGVDVRPLRQITGESHFNEVFLTDAKAPAGNLIGARDDGWRTMQTALAIERSAMGERNLGLRTRSARSAGRSVDPADLVDLARRHGRLADPVLRQAVARGVTLAAVQVWNEARARVEGRTSRLPLLSKLAMARLLHTTAQVRRDILGAGAMLDGPDDADAYDTNFLTLNAYFTSIGGGTDQIQRNIIGERALGLPREPSSDHGVPFRQVRKPGRPVSPVPPG